MPSRDRDDESGKYTSVFQDDDFLDAIRYLGGNAGTTEVADKVGCDRRTAYVRLANLRENNILSSRKVGSALLWSLNADIDE